MSRSKAAESEADRSWTAFPKFQFPILLKFESTTKARMFVFLQNQQGVFDRPIPYMYHIFRDAKWAYNTLHREGLAAVCVILLLRSFFGGCVLTDRTEQDKLKWITNMIEATGKLGWPLLRLSQLRIGVSPQSRGIYLVPNTPSRLTTSGNGHTPIEDDIKILCCIPMSHIGKEEPSVRYMCDRDVLDDR